MLHKIVDLFKEVFWLKPSSKKKAKARKPKPSKKSPAKKKSAPKKIAPKKKLVVKPVKAPKLPKAPKVKTPALDPALVAVGEVTHYFERIKVCVVKITQGTILIGDKLTIVTAKAKFVQKVWSMQIESEDVKVAKKGQLIGLKVDKIVQAGDKVYK